MYKEVIVGGGYSESPEALEPLLEAATNGPNAIARNGAIITLNRSLQLEAPRWGSDGQSNPLIDRVYALMLNQRLVGGEIRLPKEAVFLANSAACMADEIVRRSARVVGLSSVEPTRVQDQVSGAIKILRGKVPSQLESEGIEDLGVLPPVKEVWVKDPRYNRTFPVQRLVREFSAVDALIAHRISNPGDPHILASMSLDEFGFHRQDVIDKAATHPDQVRHVTVEGANHSAPLFHPTQVLGRVKPLL